MQSHIAIKHLEQYIKATAKKWGIYSRIEKWYTVDFDDRIQSAMEQIELYRIGRWRLQNTWISAI